MELFLFFSEESGESLRHTEVATCGKCFGPKGIQK